MNYVLSHVTFLMIDWYTEMPNLKSMSYSFLSETEEIKELCSEQSSICVPLRQTSSWKLHKYSKTWQFEVSFWISSQSWLQGQKLLQGEKLF